MSKYRQGYFKPLNPKKYRGNPLNIVYRSSWELKLLSYLDKHPDVIEWSSEEFYIGYLSPIDGKMHRYFPDAWVKMKDKKNEVQTFVVEVKPLRQTKPPTKPKKESKRYLQEMHTWLINNSKFEAAENYCKKKGWKFIILTERELFSDQKKR
jgi:hypothetical protein